MGIHEGKRIWRTGAEEGFARAEAKDLTESDLIERSRVQAKNFIAQNAHLGSVFISAGHRDTILEAGNQMSAARALVRNEPHFIPETIDELDHQAAFLIALAEELSKPEYNQ